MRPNSITLAPVARPQTDVSAVAVLRSMVTLGSGELIHWMTPAYLCHPLCFQSQTDRHSATHTHTHTHTHVRAGIPECHDSKTVAVIRVTLIM